MANLKCNHGVAAARGCGHLGLGSFSRLFPNLSPNYVHDSLIEALGKPGGLMDGDTTPDSNIPAGYTFFAQFVDHDVTLDTQSKLDSDWVQNPDQLPNFRSASLDLDCVYGFGPEASPHLYDNNAEGKLITSGRDLARAPDGTALIGDPRNDENIFVAAMHNALIKLHNRFIDEGMHFEEAQRECRYHYQYVVLHDFLKQVCDPALYKFAIDRIYRHQFPLCYGPDAHGKLPMPVEFSVAAYRFGHSMVRSNYHVKRINKSGGRKIAIELFSEAFASGGFTPLPDNIRIDWECLLRINGSAPDLSKGIDGKLATELNSLPFLEEGEPVENRRSLSFRNLLRGRSLGLPSGQAVAGALCDCGYDFPLEPLRLNARQFPGLGDLSAKDKDALLHETPLFFYLLAEGGDTNSLGPTGSALLLEVFAGMLIHCNTSYFSDPSWSPKNDLIGCDHELTLADLVAYAEGL